jgi:hypothetical protein
MRLAGVLEYVATRATPETFEGFRAHLLPEWIEEALAATGTATLRRRRLPAVQVLWIVLGMALFRNRSIERVVASLDLALPDRRGELVAKSAIVQARQRLGEEPLAYLFLATAAEWATRSAARHRWRGLSLYAADGTTLRIADSPQNRAAFGDQAAGGERGRSGYPMVRALALVAARSHLLSAFRFADYHTGEVTLARELWRELPDQTLVLLDRNFLVTTELIHLERSGVERHWLTRAKSTTRMRTVHKLGRHDAIVEIPVPQAAQKAHPDLPEVWWVRAVRYQKKGFRPSTLLTSLLDDEQYPAAELVALYHERWDIELCYDEVKTHLLAREECIRSRTPEGVRQELWAIALAYNLVRLEMERVADEAGVPPNRLSFVTALDLIRDEWLWCSNSTPGAIPKQLDALASRLKLLLLPERRPSRVYPRAVKIKMTNYPRKRPTLPRPK